MQLSSLIKNTLIVLSVAALTKAVSTYRKRANKAALVELLEYDANSIYRGLIKAYRSPLNWKEKEVLTLAILLAGIGILFHYDKEISQWFRKKGETASPVLKDFGWYYGSPENHYVIKAGFYLYGLFSGNENIRKTGVLLISATLAAGILQTILKVLIGRARPLRDEGKLSFRPFSSENYYYSLPSGHTILSFTTAYAIGKQFTHPLPKTGIFAFGFIAPLSRLWAGAHWITDAATSICLSIPIVNSIESFLNKERELPRQTR